MWREGFRFIKAGIVLLDLHRPTALPASLFPTRNPKRSAILMRPGEGHLEACPMPALNKHFTTYTLTPDQVAQKQAAE